MAEQTLHQCPHLGILDDPNTSHSFPSTWNACFYAKLPTVPTFEHQELVCLTDGYVSCPVYQAAKGTPFPVNLQNKVKPPKQPEAQRRTFIYIAGAVFFLVLILGGVAIGFKFPGASNFSLPVISRMETKPATTETTVVQPTATLEVIATSTQAVVLTVTSTVETPPTVLEPFALETPFKIGEQDFLIHRVKDGDVLDFLEKTYHTTSQVIQASNYAMKIPIWVDSLMLIRPDVTDIDPAEPPFEIYIVTDKAITLDELAKKLNVDLAKLKYYNACVDRCFVNRNTWVLVPRHR